MLACARVCRRRSSLNLWRSFSSAAEGEEENFSKEIPYVKWLNDEGRQFKRARPRNWLGGEVVESFYCWYCCCFLTVPLSLSH